MHSVIYLIPLVAAFIGWCLSYIGSRLLFYPVYPKKIAGYRMQGLFPRYQQQVFSQLLRYFSSAIDSSNILEEKILAPENLQRIMPEVEGHIDHFLKVKLKVSMPMIGMLIGERTISQLKEIFMRELEELFPIILKSYMSSAKEAFNLEEFLQAKLVKAPPIDMMAAFADALRPFTARLQAFGALAGFTIGCVDLLLFLLLR